MLPVVLDFVGSSWGAGPRAPSALCSGHAPTHVGWIVGVSRDLWAAAGTPAPVSFQAQLFMTGHLAYVWIKGQGQGWAGLGCSAGVELSGQSVTLTPPRGPWRTGQRLPGVFFNELTPAHVPSLSPTQQHLYSVE